MKKLMTTVACVAVAVAMTGCTRSPSTVAEKFAEAVIERETEDAVGYFDTTSFEGSEKRIKQLKELLENSGKEINDNKLEAEAIGDEITIPAEDAGYKIVNGKKYTGEKAKVTIQFIKGKDKKSDGMAVSLSKVDGSWKVSDYKLISGLD